jgi:uncharacterized protein with HEPN domain
MDFDAFAGNRVAQLAVSHCLEIMGEAARHVPPEVQARCPEVAWRQMNDMRNVLIHAYTIVDLVVVWQAVTRDVPPTRERLIRFLEEESGKES